jgi:Rrf2 family protein
MLDLALHDEGEYIPVKDISQRQDISTKYIEQIITLLNRAGFLKSIRGNHGGYMLNRKPQDYTVGMILRAAEGSLAPVACLNDDPNQCSRSKICPTLSLWTRLNDAINSVVDYTTLQDVLDEIQNSTSQNYII